MAAGSTGLMWDARFLDHDTGTAILSWSLPSDSVWSPQRHVAGPGLVGRVKTLLERAGLDKDLTPIAARAATTDELALVHTREHIAHIKRVCDAGGGEAGEFAPASRETHLAALLSAGGALAAVDAVLNGTVRNAYGLNRPPGHHATPDKAMGFCFFNNVAVAARYAQRQHGLKKVAILDWDVHHGNGTQTIFYDDPSVLFVSLHEDNNYPQGSGLVEQRGVGAGEGFTINLPLPAGTGRAGYLAALDRVVLPAIRRFGPELILVSAGQDASHFDPLARMSLSADGFQQLATRMAALADEVCGGRLVALHEGGYSEAYAPICTWAIIEGMSGLRSGLEDPLAGFVDGIAASHEVGMAEEYIARAERSIA